MIEAVCESREGVRVVGRMVEEWWKNGGENIMRVVGRVMGNVLWMGEGKWGFRRHTLLAGA